MDDLVQWLGEQLDEEERRTRQTAEGYGAVWTADESMDSVRGDTGADVIEEPHAPHQYIAEHDPARVLREIDAKRQLIARGGPFCTSGCDDPGNEPENPDTNWTTSMEHHTDCAAYEAAKVLALPYRVRPGYREEWRP